MQQSFTGSGLRSSVGVCLPRAQRYSQAGVSFLIFKADYCCQIIQTISLRTHFKISMPKYANENNIQLFRQKKSIKMCPVVYFHSKVGWFEAFSKRNQRIDPTQSIESDGGVRYKGVVLDTAHVLTLSLTLPVPGLTPKASGIGSCPL